jgi:hypothetical protein
MRKSFTVARLRMRSGSYARGPMSHLLIVSEGGSCGSHLSLRIGLASGQAFRRADLSLRRVLRL